MTYRAQVLHQNEDVEEEVVLLIEGLSLTCFVNVCLYPIAEGQVYPVNLSLWSLDGFELREMSEKEPDAIKRLGSEFPYSLTGRLYNGQIEAEGLTFVEPEFAKEFQYLDGKKVRLVADRLEAAFTTRADVFSK